MNRDLGLAQPDDLRELLAHVAIGKCLLNADAKMRAPPGEFVAACVNSSDLAKLNLTRDGLDQLL